MNTMETYDASEIRTRAAREAARTSRPAVDFFEEMFARNPSRFRIFGSSGLLWKVAGGLAGQIAALSGVSLTVPARFEAHWEYLAAVLRKYGVVNEVRLLPPAPDDPALYYFDIDAFFNPRETDGVRPRYTRYSRGVSNSYDEAVSKVFGECLERLPLAQYHTCDLHRASVEDLRRAQMRFLNPRDISHFSEQQKEKRPRLRFDDTSLFRWTEAVDLVSKETVLVPAQLVYWNYGTSMDDGFEPTLAETSTHGAGGYFSRDGAILSGLYEHIQRDAFFGFWLRHERPSRIDMSAADDEVTLGLLAELRALNISATFLDTTSDIRVPSVACALTCDMPGRPRLVLAASADTDSRKAIRRSLVEACSIYQWIRRQEGEVILPDQYEPFSAGWMGSRERVLLWARQGALHRSDFFSAGELRAYADFVAFGKTFESESDELAWVVGQICHVIPEASMLYVEARHPALREVGFHSVQVLVPGLFPLYSVENNVPLAHPRLEGSIPYGYPHPFP